MRKSQENPLRKTPQTSRTSLQTEPLSQSSSRSPKKTHFLKPHNPQEPAADVGVDSIRQNLFKVLFQVRIQAYRARFPTVRGEMKNPEAKSVVLQDPDVGSMDTSGFSRIYAAASVRDSSLDRWRRKRKGLIPE
ncbi:hypothetical protein MRB53_026776 [Persea americana]|uniref:Uncharacterized protein n=1 Tax=Persea americana TaxID=3435 RepID=A0ACC2LJK2_PERAE|nr:hypothetical protein MRB53_026776 [Persea americana]